MKASLWVLMTGCVCAALRYRRHPWHPATLPIDLSCRHVLQRMLLVFTGREGRIWVLLGKCNESVCLADAGRSVCSADFLFPAAPDLHLPTAAALRTHAVTWAANMVVQEALPSAYYDHEVNTLGVFSLQHNGRQHGRTDGVCFNTLVALAPDYVRRDEDGEKVESTGTGRPPPVENPRYVWFEVRQPTLRRSLLEKTQTPNMLPLHSLY